MENAMRSLERDYGINYWFIWQLRHRRERLKTISHSVFERLRLAYQYECERQVRKLQDEITKTNPDYVATAQALVREIDGEMK